MFLSTAVALALGCSGAALVAQPAATTVVLTPDQQTIYSGWPAAQRTAYDAWTDSYKTYYWTLTPDQAKGWWALTDAQRSQVYAMTPEQRVQAWNSIVAQLNGTPAAATTTTTTTTTTAAPASVTTTGNMTPPPAEAMNKTYPVCTSKLQDSCQNPGEGGAPGRSRAINHYRPH